MTSHDDRPHGPEPESRFFLPTDRCPNPERWTSTDGDSTELEVTELVAALVRATQPTLVVETGAAFGQTTEAIARALHRNGLGHLVSFEIDEERAAFAEARIGRVESELRDSGFVSIHRADPTSWTPSVLGSTPIGLMFLDTKREARVAEFHHFLPACRPGAIAVIHDSAWDVGPLRGWIENTIVAEGYGRAIDIPTPRGVTLIEVKPPHPVRTTYR